MFRFLSRLFTALAALFALRLLFAAARRVNRAREAPKVAPSRPDARSRNAEPSHAPRIDPALAEDVPFVEVPSEPENRSG